MKIPENLLYTKEHEWILVEDTTVTIGITEYAQDQLGDIVFVETPDQGANISAMSSFGVVESVKTVSDLYAPVSGEILEVNSSLEAGPELVNSDPYGEGWIIKIKMSDPGEVNNLLSSEKYTAYVEEEQK